MDIIAIGGAIGVIVSIIAGIVQVLDYSEKRRKKRRMLKKQKEIEAQKQRIQPTHFSPYNLPRTPVVIGREKDIESIEQAFKSYSPVVVIEGLGGVGKTTLAILISNRLWESHQFEQVVWISAKGRSINLSTLLDEIAIAVEYPYISQLPLHRKTIEITKILRSIPCLLVIDNFDTISDDAKEDLSAFLLILPSPSKALVTSRPPLSGEQLVPHNVFMHPLTGLEQEASVSLILNEGKRLGITTIQTTQSQLLDELYDITGGNPLAIILSVGQMKQASYSLEAIINRLHKAKDNLFQDIFGTSWTLLEENAKKLFRATPLFASPFSKEALFATQELQDLEMEEAFTQLLQFSLIQSNNALKDCELRFETHPLTRAFAESKLNEFGEEKRRIAISLAKFFLKLAQRYEVRFWEGREVYEPLETERLNILSIMDWCWDNCQLEFFANLSRAISDFLIVKGYWQLCLTYGEKAVEAASKLKDKNLQAWILVHMKGYVYANRHETSDAQHALTEALELYKQTSNSFGISETLRNLARVFRKNGDFTRAESLYNECYQVATEIGDKKLTSLALNEMGKLERDQGKLLQAMALFNSAKLEVEDVDSSIHAGILCNMAGVAIDSGDLGKAQEYSVESLQFFSRIDNQEGIATTKWRLAQINLFQQQTEQALDLARESYEIFSKLGMKKECLKLREMIARISSTSTK